jgi:hypothetical protein
VLLRILARFEAVQAVQSRLPVGAARAMSDANAVISGIATGT